MHSLILSRLKLFGFGEKSLNLRWAQDSLSGVISHGELRGQTVKSGLSQSPWKTAVTRAETQSLIEEADLERRVEKQTRMTRDLRLWGHEAWGKRGKGKMRAHAGTHAFICIHTYIHAHTQAYTYTGNKEFPGVV